jgi:hypothetical protein
MLWALLGSEIQRFALSHRIQQPSQSESVVQPPTPRLPTLRSALMTGIASALGYTIGLVLGLPRGNCKEGEPSSTYFRVRRFISSLKIMRHTTRYFVYRSMVIVVPS